MQTIKVGSIIEILNHDGVVNLGKASGSGQDYAAYYLGRYPIGSKHEVLAFHPVTGEVEVSYDHNPDEDEWHTFFPGEYKLVE